MQEIDQKILNHLKKIPKWQVTTYKILADIFWVHPRKIASVMRYNKNPEIYPCYKVISHSWKVSWYSAFDWVSDKLKMLEKDWIEIVNWKIWRKFIFDYKNL